MRVLQVSRHAHAGHDPGGRGEVDGEDGPEVVSFGVGRGERRRADHVGLPAQEKADEGERERGEDEILDADGKAGADERDEGEQDADRGGDQLGAAELEERAEGVQGLERLGEADNVKGDRDGLGEAEGDADAAADLDAEAA